MAVDHCEIPDTEPDSEPTSTDQPEQRKNGRRVRAKTISMKRLPLSERGSYNSVRSHWRPQTRADCVDDQRPCPYVSCKYHLYLDVSFRTGSIKLNFPDTEVWEMEHSCALDLAASGGMTLEETGGVMNLTRERIRQIEVKALERLEAFRDILDPKLK